MGLHDLVDDCFVFFFLSLVYRVLIVFTDHRTVGGDLHNVHSINLTEFLFFRQCGTGHTGFFRIFIKEILERNRCQGLALSFYLHMLFCFDRLVQTVGITSAGHQTAGKFIHDDDFIFLNHIILIPEHQIVGPQRQDHIVLDLDIFRIRQVFNLEEFLYSAHAFRSQVHLLIFFIYNKITGLLDVLSHNGIHLGEFFALLTAL